MSKEQIIEKNKKGSLWIGIVCVLAVLFNLLIISWGIYAHRDVLEIDAVTRYVFIREFVTYGLSAVIMLLASLLFFRVAKSGVPFSAKNVRAVRIIGILFLLNAVFPSVTDVGAVITPFTVQNYTSLLEGLLFLFIAHFIRYGAMLQQESDETL